MAKKLKTETEVPGGVEYHGMVSLPRERRTPNGDHYWHVWPHDIVEIEGQDTPGTCKVYIARAGNPGVNKHHLIRLSSEEVCFKVWDAMVRFASAGFMAELSRNTVSEVIKASAAMSVERVERELPDIIRAGLKPAVLEVLEDITDERINESAKPKPAGK